MAGSPSYNDADLLLRVYDMRRETRLRQARDFVLGKASFTDFADFKKKYPMESKGSRMLGMVFTYWDMTCALVERGLLDEALFNTCNTEHVFLWMKYRAAIHGMREEYRYPAMMSSLEKVAARHPFAAQMEAWVTSQQPAAAAGKRAKAKRKAAGR